MTLFGTTVRRARVLAGAFATLALWPLAASGGAQVEEQLAPSVVAGLQRAIADNPAPADYLARADLRAWLDAMSRRLAPKIADARTREEFLGTLHYEASRAGLDPQLVLSVIQVESNFRKYAISKADARGYMQVMPFWTRLIGTPEHNLFQLRTNLRYGCVILRHYLDVENGDYFRALGRYNGSLGQAAYPSGVVAALHRNWHYDAPPPTRLGATASAATPR